MRSILRLSLLCVLLGVLLSPAWSAEVATLLTRFPDGDAKETRLNGGGGKYDLHQDDGYALLQPGTTPLFSTDPGVPLKIKVDRNAVEQEMFGYGAAMTDASADLFMRLKEKNPALYEYTMKRLFSPTEGAGFSFIRLPMGASDFTAAPAYYTYCDEPSPDLSKFSIDHDRKQIIPALKDALKLNPKIRIMGSPWSAPAWMKTHGKLVGITEAEKAAGAVNKLKPECFEVYADYFVKFIEQYQAAGVEIWAVTLQNEPQTDLLRYPCMRLDEADQIRLVRLLGPKLAARGLKTKIFVHDHNWELHPGDRKVLGGDAKMDPVASVTQIFQDSEAGRYIAGSAWHCYSGGAEAMKKAYQAIHQKFPDKMILGTEISAWGKNRGGWWGHVRSRMAMSWMGGPQNGCQAIQEWNLALDQKYGPTLRDDSAGIGVVTVRSDTWQEVKFEREFYGLAQMSRAAQSGSRRVATSVEGDDPNKDLDVVAFSAPEGKTTLAVFNKNEGDRAFQVKAGGSFFQYTLPGRSLVTFAW
ncbi:MAG TPA: glycoside hydrolase family 30 protein [Candidatus Sumerlaeota bacterium]|nr:glycoside hydrolase family 30 protein [Candidatus Sumerlaeota bacterium]